MEQNKFYTEIKDKLEKRRLEPSKEAWQKLSDRLDAAEGPKKINPIWWLGVAASLIGVLLVASPFFKSETSNTIDQNTPTRIVNNPVDAVKKIEAKKDIPEANDLKEKIIPQKIDKSVAESQEEPQAVIKKNSENLKEDREAIVATVELKGKDAIGKEKPADKVANRNAFEAQKIEDIVKNVEAVAKNQGEVSSAYIDSLLSAAEKDIQRQKFNNNTNGTVDADALLADVENELDESFRTKVFDALKSSFKSVKTAVANRNN